MGTRIVTVNVSQTISATPSGLQQMAAVLSFGATTLEKDEPVLLTQASDMTDALAVAIDALDYETTTYGADIILTLPAGVEIDRETGSTFSITLSGCSPSSWNGTFDATLEDSRTLTWQIKNAPKAKPTETGTFTIGSSTELVTAADDYFAQGSTNGLYLIELGYYEDQPEKEIAALKAWIDDPAQRMYAYLVPQAWDGEKEFIALAKLHTSNESMLYFFVTTDGPDNPYSGIKSVIACSGENYPDELTAAAVMWNFVSPSPSEINKVPPMAFRFLQGMTATTAKASVTTTLEKNNVNYVDTGAEGGISNAILKKGVTCDGNDMTYWYSVDWVQINADLMLANAIINGSNNPINPLYYNQDGIDRLQQVAQGVFNTGVSYGLVNGAPVVNAIRFKTYTTDNPTDYKEGRYAGFSATYTPMRGFTEIVFNINVTLQLS